MSSPDSTDFRFLYSPAVLAVNFSRRTGKDGLMLPSSRNALETNLENSGEPSAVVPVRVRQAVVAIDAGKTAIRDTVVQVATSKPTTQFPLHEPIKYNA